MDSIEVKIWLGHSSNLYFVNIKVEISPVEMPPVTMRDCQSTRINYSYSRLTA
jgi:hypothetical protein